MHTNGGDYDITITPTIIDAQTIGITAATSGSTTVPTLNYSLLVYDVTLLTAQPNIFVDYGSVSATNGNWAGLDISNRLIWWNPIDDLNFMFGISAISYSGNQPMKFQFNYDNMAWTSTSQFISIRVYYWNYREAVPCTTGYQADGTTSDCFEICGDGFLYALACDDGNILDGDGCSSACTIEVGWNCSGGSHTHASVCTEVCGDGLLFNFACDDGNLINRDGCSSTCTIEAGFNCMDGSPLTASTCTEICGDGFLYALACDDGNTLSGDGCSSTCALETGWNCAGGSFSTPSVCTQICGDGLLFRLPCDDGNLRNGDGCSSTCTIETGYGCTYSSPSICTEICGDGIVVYLPCDDGNTASGDGCSSTCLIESGWNCTGGNITTPSSCFILRQLTIQLIQTIKEITNNSVLFYFELNPVTDDLANLNYSQILTTNLSGVSLTYTYIGNGKLEVRADYNTIDMQGQSISMQVDPIQSGLASFIHYIPSTYSFVVDPDNNIPAYPYDGSTYLRAGVFRWIALAVSLLFVGVFLLSLFTKRYIGVEMMGVAQVAFFGLMIITEWEPILASMSYMSYVNGINAQIQEDSHAAMETPSPLSGLQIDAPMLSNFNYVLIFLLLPLFMSLVFFVGSKISKVYSRQEKLIKLSKIALCQYGLTAVLCLEYQWVASWEVFAMYERQTDVIKLPSSLAVLVLSFAIIVGELVLFKIMQAPFGQYKTAFQSSGFCQNYYWYIMGSRFVLISLMVFGSSFKYIGFICLFVPTVNTIILCVKRPYKEKADLGRAIGNQALTILILCIYSYYAGFVHYTGHDEPINTALPYVVIAALCVCIALNLAFLIKTVIMFAKEKKQFEEDKQLAAKYREDSKKREGESREVVLMKKRESVAISSSKQMQSRMRKFMMPESISPMMQRKNQDPALQKSLEKDRTITVASFKKPTSGPRAVEATINNTLLDKSKMVKAQLGMPTLSEIKQRYFKQ